MKKILLLLLLGCTVAVQSCRDEVEVGNLSFPPSVLTMFPSDNGKVPIGGFDLRVVLVDGVGSPLSSATVTLKDADDTELYTLSKTISGTKDSVVVDGEEFDAADLPEGSYKLLLTATDNAGNTTEKTASFSIVNSLYASVETEMYIAGEFNGWGSSVMELVANNTWEIKNINLNGGKWKFKNTTDWSDTDWGDSDCNGVMEITSGGGADTDCGYTGLVNVRFNDLTLAYQIISTVNYAHTIDNLYLLGSFNNFEGSDYRFSLVANNTWELKEIRLKAGDQFRFAENSSFEGKNFGDADDNGVAEEFGPNIVREDGSADAFYKVTFNDASLAYSLELVRYPFPANLYLVGGSTSAGWTPGNSIPFVKTADGVFEIYAYLQVADGFKFLQQKDWPGDWGKGDDGKLLQEGESNVTIASDGFYRITADFTTMSYSVTKTDWGLVGKARTGTDAGWSADSDMTFTGGTAGYSWEVTMHLFAGEFKFRANDGWDINFGDNGLDGTLDFNAGTNMSISAEGDYVVEMVLDPVNGYTYTVTPD